MDRQLGISVHAGGSFLQNCPEQVESMENLLTIAGGSVLLNERTGAAGGESVENLLKCPGINAGIRSQDKVCLVDLQEN